MRIFWGYCLVWKLSWQRNASWYLECITNLVVSCGILPAHPTKPRVHEKHPFWGRAVNVCLSNFPCPVKHRQNPEVLWSIQTLTCLQYIVGIVAKREAVHIMILVVLAPHPFHMVHFGQKILHGWAKPRLHSNVERPLVVPNETLG